MTTVKHETLADLLLLAAQQAQTYQDHKSELAAELDDLEGLLTQIAARFPIVAAIDNAREALREDQEALREAAPEYLIQALDELQALVNTVKETNR